MIWVFDVLLPRIAFWMSAMMPQTETIMKIDTKPAIMTRTPSLRSGTRMYLISPQKKAITAHPIAIGIRSATALPTATMNACVDERFPVPAPAHAFVVVVLALPKKVVLRKSNIPESEKMIKSETRPHTMSSLPSLLTSLSALL